MAQFCLLPKHIESFKKALKSGEINPEKLSGMTSPERRAYLGKIVGEENAVATNALFESKLLLKNQKAGMINWARKVSGLSNQAKRDLISRVERLDKVLDPQEERAFLQDLASTRLGVNINIDEAKKITELSKKISDLTNKTDITKSDVVLGRAKLDLTDYINSISGKKANLFTNVAGVPRSLMASLDLSAPLNQGWGMVSRRQFYTNLGNMVKYAGSKNSFRDLQAYIITHPRYEIAKKAGLRLTDLGDKLEFREEQFMSTLLDRVPGIAASQRAYTGFLNKLRFDVFDDLIKKAEVSGENISIGSKTAKDIANVVNNFTGGARVGKVEGATPFLNAVFFSPRKIASTLQIMNPKNYLDPGISKTARLAATRNLIGSLSLSASIISLYSLLTGKKQESDPNSSNFGKIKSGNTGLDISGGNANYLTLMSRIISGKIKNSTGVTKDLGNNFGQISAFDLIAQFTRNKLSPNASFLIDSVTRSNAIGQNKTISESVIDRMKPIFANSVVDLLKSDTDGKFAFALGGLIGGGLSTYSPTVDWENSTTKELKQLRSKIGDKKFKEANDKFNTEYGDYLDGIAKSNSFKKLSDENKDETISKNKKKIKEKIFDQYNFKYKRKTN